MSVVDAVEREILALPAEAQDSAHAAMARALARRMDDESASVSAMAAAARELRENLDRLRESAPAQANKDGIDGIADAFAARRARVAAATDR